MSNGGPRWTWVNQHHISHLTESPAFFFVIALDQFVAHLARPSCLTIQPLELVSEDVQNEWHKAGAYSEFAWLGIGQHRFVSEP